MSPIWIINLFSHTELLDVFVSFTLRKTANHIKIDGERKPPASFVYGNAGKAVAGCATEAPRRDAARS